MTSPRIPYYVLCLLIVIGALAPSPSVFADEAKQKYAQGVELYNSEQFVEAAKAFREAYRLKPTWKIHFNIGQSEAAAKRYGEALEAFEEYLVGGGDDIPEERREEVTREIRRIGVLVGTLKIEGTITADIVIDGELREHLPLKSPLRVTAGKHQLVIKKGQTVVHAESVKIVGQMETVVTLHEESGVEEQRSAKRALASDDPTGNRSLEKDQSRIKSPLKPVGITVLAIGSGATAAGAITGALALSKFGELEENCPTRSECAAEDMDLVTSKDRLATVTNILLPIGVTAAVIGFVLLMVGKKKEPMAGDKQHISAVPFASHCGGGFILGGRF